MGLLRGSLSLYYQGFIPYTSERDRRVWLAAQVVEFGRRAISDFRACGHSSHLGTTLSNTSNALSELAGLETTREGRGRLLGQALENVEEAIELYRGLGLQADIAMSLGTANICYRAMADAAEDSDSRVELLKRALASIEEAVELFRALGIAQYLLQALRDSILTHDLMGQSITPDLDRLTELCAEGEALAQEMGDPDAKSFFTGIREQLLR